MWSVVCVLEVLTPIFKVLTHKTPTTCRNVPTFEDSYGAAYRSHLLDPLHGNLSGHKQRRQRKLHHPLDNRLRTPVQ